MSLKRTKRQINAVNAWIKNSKRGTLEFATGVGKTKTSIIAIKKLSKKEKLRVHVVVPTKYLQNQWIKELKSNKIIGEVYVINTYLKLNLPCDLLILDEIHNYGSMKRLQVFNKSYKYLLGLTATVERKDSTHSIILSYAPIVDKIDLEEAREEGYVSNYLVFNLGIKLSEMESVYYSYLNKSFYKHFSVFGRNFNLAMSCMTDEAARKRYASLSGFEEKYIAFHAVRFNKYMQDRKNFLYNIKSKQQVAKEILDLFPESKAITFSENTSVADELTELIPDSVSYHTKIPKKDREKSLKNFNDGRSSIRVINTSKMLDEGADINDVDLIIITSSRAVKRVQIQRQGRGIRFRPGKTAIIVNIYVLNSKDQEWLEQRQEGSNNIYWIEDVKRIKQIKDSTSK